MVKALRLCISFAVLCRLARALRRDVIAVVDPYSSGALLVQELRDRGETLIAINSIPKWVPFAAPLNADRDACAKGEASRFAAVFDIEDIVVEPAANDTELQAALQPAPGSQAAILREKPIPTLDENTDDGAFVSPQARQLVAKIRDAGFDVRAVLVGSDPGVQLVDEMSAVLGLPHRNSPRTTQLRKNKYFTNEALRRAGVTVAKQKWTASSDEAIAWMHSENLEFPIILKPVEGSAGSESVHKCLSDEDIRVAFAKEVESGETRWAPFGLLAQEFLVGREYVVDTMSFGANKHYPVAFCKYIKLPDRTYLETELLPADGVVQGVLREYAQRALDAVGLHYGPAHLEVMLTSEGARMVEINARMHGSSGTTMIKRGTGTSVYEYYADLAQATLHGVVDLAAAGSVVPLHLQQLLAVPAKKFHYTRANFSSYVCFNNRPEWNLTGNLVEELGSFLPRTRDEDIADNVAQLAQMSKEEAAKNFETFAAPGVVSDLVAGVHKGDSLEATVDLVNIPAVFTVSGGEQECRAAVARFRELERGILEHAIGHQQKTPQLATIFM